MIEEWQKKTGKNVQPQVFVSVHVRRTDYEYHLSMTRKGGGKFLSKVYYENGMDYFRSRFQDVMFVGKQKCY